MAINSAATEGRLTYGSYGFLNAGDNVSVTATFSEAVIVESGTPTLTLAVDSDNRTATYTSGDNSTLLVFRYTIRAGDTDSDGISIRANSLDNNSSTIRDAALNDAILSHSAWSTNYAYIVDNTPPTVSSVAITDEDGEQYNFLNEDDEVEVTTTFNEVFPSSVIVDNPSAATLTLVVGSTNRTATYASGSNSTPPSANDNSSLVFEYTIQATGTLGENDSNGISIIADALNSNIITISDRAGNIATSDNLTHSAVPDDSNYKVDTTAPSVITFEMDDREIKTGETSPVTLEFSEAVCADYGVCGSNVFTSAADITVISDNGNVSASGSLTLNSDQAIDNKTIWTGTFTPYAPREVDINRLSLATTYTDLAGNNGPDNQTENFDVDTKPPSVDSFTMSDVNLSRNDNATVELRFSEPVIDFDSDYDITIPNLNQEPLHDNSTASGTLYTMISDDNITWTGTFIPAFPISNTEDWTNRLVLSDNYTDYDNNAGSGKTGENYIVDDKDPSVISFTIEGNGISDTQLLYNETATVTLVFSEAVASFSSAADITAAGTAGASDNGSLATMTSSDNITW
ncbi:MAG TPA: hypothetical protein EYN68_12225, partial [Candidatus Marinimicrobia bacterium]|nr:hypothetical protein [Candidatus Neomarinimicrobiota bacterium]